MKFSVSVPDDLWASALPDDSTGPSETVQMALRVLAERRRAELRPLAHAPDQANLDRYRPAFESAVDAAATAIRQARDNGYRFGLLLAPGLTCVDFEELDDPYTGVEIGELVKLGEAWSDIGYEWRLSWDFCDFVSSLPDGYDEILEDSSTSVSGVRWEQDESPATVDPWEGGYLPVLSDDFTEGILDALRDVRDEARRRMTTEPPAESVDQ